MNEKYIVKYSSVALQDLKDIYGYIAFELKEPSIAKKQVDRIRNDIKGLSDFPNRFHLVEFEPFHSMEMRQFAVNNYVVFYLTDDKNYSVNIIRILYGGRDIENTLKEIQG
ncbi:MAG: type II toxin-antitoxin system RelE/ParE family toxin [Ruminococcus sp.]|nr:type II toxin-antitoxin system RelE/ParE family toxin [Candidatus Copronaster equi]